MSQTDGTTLTVNKCDPAVNPNPDRECANAAYIKRYNIIVVATLSSTPLEQNYEVFFTVVIGPDCSNTVITFNNDISDQIYTVKHFGFGNYITL
jgi:hypothetical protein